MDTLSIAVFKSSSFCPFYPRFEVIGYGCATCVGNTAPLPDTVVDAINKVHYTPKSVLTPL